VTVQRVIRVIVSPSDWGPAEASQSPPAGSAANDFLDVFTQFCVMFTRDVVHFGS